MKQTHKHKQTDQIHMQHSIFHLIFLNLTYAKHTRDLRVDLGRT